MGALPGRIGRELVPASGPVDQVDRNEGLGRCRSQGRVPGRSAKEGRQTGKEGLQVAKPAGSRAQAFSRFFPEAKQESVALARIAGPQSGESEAGLAEV